MAYSDTGQNPRCKIVFVSCEFNKFYDLNHKFTFSNQFLPKTVRCIVKMAIQRTVLALCFKV